MEENKKFRNHISIVAEQIGGGFAALAAVAVGILFQNIEELTEFDFSFATAGRGLMIVGGIILLFLILAVRQIWLWSKTWIGIEDQTIVIERNTLNQKVNTIGIKNISNINTEQSIFETIIGTCKIKIDTSSLSTADQTDVKIVLKKADADAFRHQVMRLMREAEEQKRGVPVPGAVWEEADLASEPEEGKESFDITTSSADIIRHGLCSITIFSVVVMLVALGGLIAFLAQLAEKGDVMEAITGSVVGIFVAFSFVLSSLWDIVKDFVRYFEFRVKRKSDRIYIRYGILKKVEYAVPVDKIQALKINQTLIARASGMCMAELINVGMGDDEKEQKSFFILYGKKKDVEEKIARILPEFAGAAGEKLERQPAVSLAAKAVPLLLYEAALILSVAAAFSFLETPDLEKYRILAAAAGVFLGLLAPVMVILNYFTAGLSVDGSFLRTAHGYFGRTLVAVKYNKIQYVELKQGMAARLGSIWKGSLHLLAAAGAREHSIPYFRGELAEKIRMKMLER